MTLTTWNRTGIEEVLTCRDCGCRSDQDLRGIDAFTNVLRGGGCIRVCKPCAAVDAYGNSGLMAQLIKATRESKPRIELVVQYADVKIPVFPARAPSAAELEAHAAVCAAYAAKNHCLVQV
jgi:hypothetical protein